MANYLKLMEVAHRLGISERTARRYVQAGELPSVYVGGAYRVSEEDLEAFVESRRSKAGKAYAPSPSGHSEYEPSPDQAPPVPVDPSSWPSVPEDLAKVGHPNGILSMTEEDYGQLWRPGITLRDAEGIVRQAARELSDLEPKIAAWEAGNDIDARLRGVSPYQGVRMRVLRAALAAHRIAIAEGAAKEDPLVIALEELASQIDRQVAA